MTPEEVQARLNAWAEAQRWTTTAALQVDCHLLAPAAISGYLCLDGLLAWAVWQTALGPDGANVPTNNGVIYEIPLPLAQVGSVWAASAALYPAGRAERVTRYRRRWPDDPYTEQWAQLPKKLITFGFDFKDKDLPVPLTVTSLVRWYARGDKAAVEQLLQLVTHLGKRHAAGTGRIGRWEVTEIEEDRSIWWDGRLMRPVPIEEVDANHGRYDVGFESFRPPYWHRGRYVECAVPPAAG